MLDCRAKSPECMTRASVGMTFSFIQEAFIKHLLRIVHTWERTRGLCRVGKMRCTEGCITAQSEAPEHMRAEPARIYPERAGEAWRGWCRVGSCQAGTEQEPPWGGELVFQNKMSCVASVDVPWPRRPWLWGTHGGARKPLCSSPEKVQGSAGSISVFKKKKRRKKEKG